MVQLKKYQRFLLTMLALWVASFSVFAQELDEAQPAQETTFEEGKDYLKVPFSIVENPVVEEIANQHQDKVQVIEFFSYGCKWCYQLDPFINNWLEEKQGFIEFQRFPVIFQPSWRGLTKAYYTASALNILNKIHTPLFKAIHSNEFTEGSDEAIQDFFIQQGVDKEEFIKTYGSFSINRQLKWAVLVAQAFRITSVPTMIIIGPSATYMTTTTMAGNGNKLMAIIDYLANEQNKALTPKEKMPVQ